MRFPGRVDVGGTVTARDIIIATGSVPFVPPGIPIDGKTVRPPPLNLLLIPCTCQALLPQQGLCRECQTAINVAL